MATRCAETEPPHRRSRPKLVRSSPCPGLVARFVPPATADSTNNRHRPQPGGGTRCRSTASSATPCPTFTPPPDRPHGGEPSSASASAASDIPDRREQRTSKPHSDPGEGYLLAKACSMPSVIDGSEDRGPSRRSGAGGSRLASWPPSLAGLVAVDERPSPGLRSFLLHGDDLEILAAVAPGDRRPPTPRVGRSILRPSATLGSHPDCFTLRPEGKMRVITADATRELITNGVWLAPCTSRSVHESNSTN